MIMQHATNKSRLTLVPRTQRVQCSSAAVPHAGSESPRSPWNVEQRGCRRMNLHRKVSMAYSMQSCQHGLEYFQHLVDSMPQGTEAVSRANGGPTQYLYSVLKKLLRK